MKPLTSMTVLAAAAFIAVTAIGAGPADAARYGKITPHERHMINHSKANLASLKRRVYRDHRVTIFERVQLRVAQARHNALVKRALRS
jgi:hypothetical protein